MSFVFQMFTFLRNGDESKIPGILFSIISIWPIELTISINVDREDVTGIVNGITVVPCWTHLLYERYVLMNVLYRGITGSLISNSVKLQSICPIESEGEKEQASCF